MAGQAADIRWRDGGVPESIRFGDPYFSLDGGLDETRHVFLGGNGLPARFAPGFRIAETGFGTGLNLLAAWEAWRRSGTPGPLRFTAFEAFPMTPADMVRAHAAFPGIAPLSAELLAGFDGARFTAPDLHLSVIPGDARQTLPAWDGTADAWFLDGFAPARNPELWEDGLIAAIAARTAPGGTFATYTAAGHVRRALATAGFTVERRAGYGRKRHMTAGWLERAGAP
ncbi:MAG: tRNA (5-methylaminomethyl-2-thiouridine)(34)-methyltransferase MnmD [Rhodobacteraceae bacterium]|nr:tRNA (5-methylaminomethyl-2-thiouridine)(34)-methyltransferase MnmD [Paracoccaceae bacterium]